MDHLNREQLHGYGVIDEHQFLIQYNKNKNLIKTMNSTIEDKSCF
jgi:hypothetical protein